MPLVHRRTAGKTLRARKPRAARIDVRGALRPVTAPPRGSDTLVEHFRELAALLAQEDHLGVAAAYLAIGDLILQHGEPERAHEMYRRSLAASRQAAAV